MPVNTGDFQQKSKTTTKHRKIHALLGRVFLPFFTRFQSKTGFFMPKIVLFMKNRLLNIQICKFEKKLKIKQINMQVSGRKLFHYLIKYDKI